MLLKVSSPKEPHFNCHIEIYTKKFVSVLLKGYDNMFCVSLLKYHCCRPLTKIVLFEIG